MLTSREVEICREVVDVDVLGRLGLTGARQRDARHVGRDVDVLLLPQSWLQADSALEAVEDRRGATEVQLNVRLSLRSLPRPLGGSGQWCFCSEITFVRLSEVFRIISLLLPWSDLTQLYR